MVAPLKSLFCQPVNRGELTRAPIAMLIFLATMGVLGGLSSALAICRSDGWRTGMYRMRSCRFLSASMIELMPSPTIPKTWVAPQSISVSTKRSEVFKFSGGEDVGCGVTLQTVSDGSAATAAVGVITERPAAAAT